MLYARVTIERAETGLYAAKVDWSFNQKTFRGYISESAARHAGRMGSLSVGRAPIFVN